MCGIHLIVQKSGDLEQGNPAIERMISSVTHRGPDGSSFVRLNWDEDQIWIGHNLLAISSEKESSSQPMVSPSGTFGISFNGQIYNHLDLRIELESEGIEFSTQTDTETLLYWIKKYGRKGLRKLKGMYAFVFWDSEKQLLIIHRDPFGIKPLFFARNRNSLAMCSEPAGLFASDLFKFSVNQAAVTSYLQFKFIPDGVSPWHGIKSLQPGDVIEYWEGKPMHFKIQRDASNFSDKGLKEVIHHSFNEIIPTHLPVGLMLSGGIDSSLILCHCVENRIPVIPFSIRFSFGGKEDLADQEAVEYLGRLFNIPIQWVDVSLEDMEAVFAHPLSIGPLLADGAWFLTSRISERARQLGIKVLLSGAGADEWFAGYRRHWYFYQWLRFQGFIPDSLKRHLLRILGAGKPIFREGRKAEPAQLWEFAVSTQLSSGLKHKPNGLNPLIKNLNDLEKGLMWDQNQYLINDILSLTDMATMAHGIEGRFPFLHPDITEFASQFTANERIEKGRKWMLKELLESKVGSKFVNRKKRGFGLPLPYFVASEKGKKWVESAVSNPFVESYFKPESWKEIQKGVKSEPEKWAQEILTLNILNSWLKD